MYTTYHLASASEVNTDLLDAIKAAFKSKPITITIEEDEGNYELSNNMKNILEERLKEDEESYISAQNSIEKLNEKYGL